MFRGWRLWLATITIRYIRNMHSLIRLSFYSLRWRSYTQSRHFEVKLVEQTSIENFRQSNNAIINLLENSVTSSSHFLESAECFSHLLNEWHSSNTFYMFSWEHDIGSHLQFNQNQYKSDGRIFSMSKAAVIWNFCLPRHFR